jgi:hypothetical protein
MIQKAHTFHIPVMGIGFTVDTPLKVSQFGINSVISLVDDMLMERLRKMYCEKHHFFYEEITNKEDDFRAKRITSYLNLINAIAEKKFEEIKNVVSDKCNELKEYFHFLPDTSSLKQEYLNLKAKNVSLSDIAAWIKSNLVMGSIDVNIMTKVDKPNYVHDKQLSTEYNDGHAALRGFANSDLHSSVVLSSGLNPNLYGYIENFADFFPNELGEMKKKIILKVSDYRSAMIQGKFFAKKGLWVSEYRIESGLNCGGHAFASDGNLLGPILAEFRDKRQELIQTINDVYKKACVNQNRFVPATALPVKFTAQGGVGTAEEHQFLLEHFDLDSVGWGTPFLLVPEVTNVDEKTLQKLMKATESDLYLSDISPLGVPFNSLKGNSKDEEKEANIKNGTPGSFCPKKYISVNTEFTEKSICTASREYQTIKLKRLADKNLSSEDYKEEYDKIVAKSCICVGLGTSALLVNHLDTKVEGTGVSVCPGPNMAYFPKMMSLSEMIDYIYGRKKGFIREDRPNMFVKELNVYLDFLKQKIEKLKLPISKKQHKELQAFESNLQEGMNYYHELLETCKENFLETKSSILEGLENGRQQLQNLRNSIENLDFVGNSKLVKVMP